MTCDDLGDACECNDVTMTVAFTGHRPTKAGLSWSHEGEGDWAAVEAVRAALRELKDQGEVLHAIVGGALGFDTLAARACWLERVPFSVYVPFAGQASVWPTEAQERYEAMLEAASDVRVISPGGYSAAKMHARNRAMVDDSTILFTWWDGSGGGTAHCITYAMTRLGPSRVRHLYERSTS